MLQAKERAPTPCPFAVFTFGLAVESIKEFGGASSKIPEACLNPRDKGEQNPQECQNKMDVHV
jgi:hypothetical protein